MSAIQTTEKNAATLQRETTYDPQYTIAFAVDIVETDDQLTLIGDLPGVDQRDLDIQIEKGVLTISGLLRLAKEGSDLLREFDEARYYRQFKITESIDTEKTTASFDQGVLTLTLPKAETAKPRKIEIH
ncbi:MAG: Hsp20/alpha crystallin family protein [Desulfuromonadaceae bacterium]|nr:Hsp20/alpha crystallin family protein [Desulfuromonadaceae bacterium]